MCRATGTGAALDAVTRGMKTALVEREDFSAGTSSKSSKLIHGGVRYLEKAFLNLDYAQYTLVKEALAERKHFLNCSPHLTKSLPIIVPIYDSFPKSLFWIPYYWAGVKMYDLVAGKSGLLSSSYFMGRKETQEKFPLLKQDNLSGGIVYFDGLQNDSRMNVALALTAVAMGAVCCNHVEVVDFVKNERGSIVAAKVQDKLTGENIIVNAKRIVNATGPFCDAIRNLADKDSKPLIQPSSGVHITIPSRFCSPDMGLIVPKTSDGRVLFLLPWEGSTIVGTTDEACEITSIPRPSEKEIKFVIDEVNRLLNSNVQREDIESAWSGIRPLARDPTAKDTQSLVRDHLIEVLPSGLITITGGKWTTYRKMAEDVVDRTINEDPELKEKFHDIPCRTLNMKLIGAHGWSPNLSTEIHRLGFDMDIAEHLVHNYGDKAFEVGKLAQEYKLTNRLANGYPFIEAEILYAARHEYAVTAVDALARRTRLAFLNANACHEAIPRVIEMMSEELGWDKTRRISEYNSCKDFLLSMGRVEARD